MKKDNTPAREKIQLLLSKTTGLVTTDDAQTLFNLSREQARFLLWRLTKDGWLRQLQQGLYRVIPLDSPEGALTDENPWMIANALFSPCYIGGWTAANFWGLTDQLFLKTWVMTKRPVHKKLKSVSQHDYILKQIKEESFFGTKTEWVEGNKILISDPHKTVLDFLSFPNDYTAASMIDIVQVYLESELKDSEILIAYAEKLANRAALKRLGFILTHLSSNEVALIDLCHQRMSKGYSSLSTQVPCTRIIRHWNLKVPGDLGDGPRD
jgi:predicted transcriptional regulator of viral defense system